MLHTGRYAILSLLVIAALLLSACRPVSVQPSAPKPVAAESVPAEPAVPVVRAVAKLDDINMYYEVHGKGEPLLLLHGGMSSGAETWQEHISALARNYTVIIPDARGHGRTTDSEQPFGYALMAEDYIKLLDRLGIEQANIVGWSDGAISGLYMLTNFPERVRAFVGMEPNFTVDGLFPGMIQFAADLSDVTFEAEWARSWYLDIAPEPEHFPVYLEKIREMWLTQPTFTTEDFAKNTIPILLISGAASDVVLPSHLQEWAASIPSATLKNVPGATHAYPVEARESFLADVLGFLSPLQPAAASTSLLDDATVANIETILTDTMQPLAVPGYAVCIVKDGSLVYDKGFGVTNAGGDQPVTPQSVFAIRSTTKSFTAVALMQLVDQGKVDLDAPVTTYLPYFTMADPGYEQITVRMLASHTSGLIDDEIFSNMPPKVEAPAETGAAIEWFVRALADDTLTAAPPTVWQYAGTNFILLGDIIGKVSGEPYDLYVTKHILEPLGMAHSTLDAATIPAGALVGEHVTTTDGVVEETPLSNFGGFEAPEGGIYSTCEDMTRWMQVHVNRGELDGVRILQAESYDTLWNKEAPTGMDEYFGAWSGGYGLGWSVGEDGGHFLAGHPGGSAGQNIGYQLAPDDNLGVTVLANWGTEPDAYPAWTAAADVLNALLGIESE